MAKHTPGPWMFREGKYQNHVIESAEGGYYVATVEGGIIIDGAEQEANARFIAAAPELLERMKALAALMETMLTELKHSEPQWVGTARLAAELYDTRAAIAKAEGES